MAELLPEDQPIYEFYWPNVDKESNFPTIEQIAKLFLQDVRSVQPHGPYQFCGYSTFGLVAYEMAQLLLREGQDVSFLALFDILHPKFLQMLSPSEMAWYQTLRVADRLKEYGRVLRRGSFAAVVDRLIEILVRKGKAAFWLVGRSLFRAANYPVPKAVQVIESIASNKMYDPMPYPKRFILIRAKDFRERALKDQTAGWHVCATGGVDVHFIPGDHGTMKDRPYAGGLVEKIAPYLAPAPVRAAI